MVSLAPILIAAGDIKFPGIDVSAPIVMAPAATQKIFEG
jgi:hypothetical protein